METTPILALARDHVHKKSPFCGDLIEVLRNGRTAPDIAVVVDVRTTKAHYHAGFDEVYFVLDGSMNVRLFDPRTNAVAEHLLGEHEACVIPKGVHHRITSASYRNRMCVLCIPRFDAKDEVASDKCG